MPDSPAPARFFHRDRVEYWAFIAQIVSALAVIVSLIFVGLQLRAGNDVAIRSEANDTQQQWTALRSSIYGNRDTARVLVTGMAGTPKLDPADALRFDYLLREHAWATYQLWNRARNGLTPGTSFDTGPGPDFLRILCTPGGRPAWAQIRQELPARYVRDLERLAISYAAAHRVTCFDPG